MKGVIPCFLLCLYFGNILHVLSVPPKNNEKLVQNIFVYLAVITLSDEPMIYFKNLFMLLQGTKCK